MFPRIKEFNFIFDKFYEIPDKYTGRLDLIANELFGDYRYYKALLSANNITMPMGFRVGVRPIYKAIKEEYNNDESIYLSKVDNHRTTSFDWSDYSNMSDGYVTDIYAGRNLIIPTPDSATRYMQIYGYLTKD